MMKIVDGFVWLVVTEKAREIYNTELFDLYVLYPDGSEALIDKLHILVEALENGHDIAIEVGPQDKQAAREMLAEAGYFTDNLWHIEDVKRLYECDDETAMEVMRKAMDNEATYTQVWMSIMSAANDLNLKPIDE